MSNWRDWIPDDLEDLDEFEDGGLIPESFEPIKRRPEFKETPEPKRIKPRYESEKE